MKRILPIVAVAICVAMPLSVRAQILFGADDPAVKAKIQTLQAGLEWMVKTAPELDIKAGDACNVATDGLAFAKGDKHTLAEVYGCDYGNWVKTPVALTAKDDDWDVRQVTLRKIEEWLTRRVPPMESGTLTQRSLKKVKCDPGNEGTLYRGPSPSMAKELLLEAMYRCEGNKLVQFPDLDKLH